MVRTCLCFSDADGGGERLAAEGDVSDAASVPVPVSNRRGSGGLEYSISPGEAQDSILLYRMISTDPGVMMPESGRSLTHYEAIEMIAEWIEEM